MFRSPSLALPLAGLVLIAGCPVPYDYEEDWGDWGGESTLDFTVEGEAVEARTSIYFWADSLHLSPDGEDISVRAGTSFCDMATESGYATRDYYPGVDDEDPVDVRFDGAEADPILRVDGGFAVLDSWGEDTNPLDVPENTLTVGYSGGGLAWVHGDPSACALGTSDGLEVELPSSACTDPQLVVDAPSGQIFLPAGDQILIVTQELSAIRTPASSLSWDADLGILYALSTRDSVSRVVALAESESGWEPLWSRQLGPDMVGMARVEGALVVLETFGSTSTVTVYDAVLGKRRSLLDIRQGFSKITGASDAPVFALGGPSMDTEILELSEAPEPTAPDSM